MLTNLWKKISNNIKNPKLSYIFNEKLVAYVICDKCGSNKDKIF